MAATVLTLSGTNTIASGGILVGAGGQSTIQGGTIVGPDERRVAGYRPGRVRQNILIQSVIAGVPGLTVNLPGHDLALNSVSTYTGPTTVLQGSLFVGTVNAQPTQNASISNTSSIYVNTGAVLNFDTIGSSVVNAPIVLNGTGNITLAATNNANVIINGPITNSAGGGLLATTNFGNGNQASEAGAGTVTITAFTGIGSPGNLTLNAANTFAGATTINAGNLIMGNNLALQFSQVTVGAAGNLQFANNVTGPTFTVWPCRRGGDNPGDQFGHAVRAGRHLDDR